MDGAGCIYCESDFRSVLPQLMVMDYAKQNNIKVLLDDDRAIGVPRDVMLPALKLAFVFLYKGTNREKVFFACKCTCVKNVGLSMRICIIRNPFEVCVAVKQAFGLVGKM